MIIDVSIKQYSFDHRGVSKVTYTNLYTIIKVTLSGCFLSKFVFVIITPPFDVLKDLHSRELECLTD